MAEGPRVLSDEVVVVVWGHLPDYKMPPCPLQGSLRQPSQEGLGDTGSASTAPSPLGKSATLTCPHSVAPWPGAERSALQSPRLTLTELQRGSCVDSTTPSFTHFETWNGFPDTHISLTGLESTFSLSEASDVGRHVVRGGSVSMKRSNGVSPLTAWQECFLAPGSTTMCPLDVRRGLVGPMLSWGLFDRLGQGLLHH